METSASIKILHIAQERGAALVAARVVHGIAENVTLTWAQTPASALQWLQGNRDTAAVIVEVQAQSCASFVEQLRGLGLTTPVVVVAGSAQLEPALAALNSGADGYVVAGPSLEADLPRTVAAAIERERSRRQLLTQTLTELRGHGTRCPWRARPGSAWRCSRDSSSSRVRFGRLTSGRRQRRSLSPTSSRSGTRSSRRAWRRPRCRVTRAPLN